MRSRLIKSNLSYGASKHITSIFDCTYKHDSDELADEYRFCDAEGFSCFLYLGTWCRSLSLILKKGNRIVFEVHDGEVLSMIADQIFSSIILELETASIRLTIKPRLIGVFFYARFGGKQT